MHVNKWGCSYLKLPQNICYWKICIMGFYLIPNLASTNNIMILDNVLIKNKTHSIKDLKFKGVNCHFPAQCTRPNKIIVIKVFEASCGYLSAPVRLSAQPNKRLLY